LPLSALSLTSWNWSSISSVLFGWWLPAH
jgi:hypothetical protein